MAKASKLITTAHLAMSSGWRRNILARAEAAATFPGLISTMSLEGPPMALAVRSTSMRRGGRLPLVRGSPTSSRYVRSPTALPDRAEVGSRASRAKVSSWARTSRSSLVRATSHSQSCTPDVHAIS